MSLINTSSIVSNGLLFSFDTNSIRSYPGPNITNVLTELTPRGIYTDSNRYIALTGTERQYIPSIGWVDNVKYVDIMNDYGNVYGSGGSGNCCPSLFTYGNFNVLPSTLYTYGILYKSVTGYTNGNFMYHYEYGASGYITEYGVHSTGNRTHLGDGWYWAWGTITTNASTNRFADSGMWYYDYKNYNRVYVAKVLLAAGNWTGLHPKYWPDVASSRSSSKALLDITGNSTLDTTSTAYDTSGNVVFNGSGYIDVPTNFGTVGSYTISFWARRDAESKMPIAGRVGTTFYWYGDNSWAYTHGGTWGERYYSKPTSIPLGTWGHYCVTYTGSLITIYRQGIYQDQVASTGTADFSQGFRIGSWAGSAGYQYSGLINNMQIYNRALTASEVKQNFNAHRGRFGI